MDKQKTIKQDMVKIGDVFGELVVIAEDYDREQMDVLKRPNGRHFKYYKCRCSCGKETTVQVYMLLDGRTRSCGHLRYQTREFSCTKDMTGKTINSLTVLRLDDSKSTVGGGKHAYWICKCNKCGREVSIRSSDLRAGREDCGCGFRKRVSEKVATNLYGQSFGHLHIIGRDWEGIRGGRHAYWICKCDLCGREESNSSDILLKYGKDRCKYCQGVSAGEEKICEILNDNNISFVHDKTYRDLKYDDTNGSPRFDFRITQKTDCDYIIEYDGEQHFKPTVPFDINETFDKRQKRDQFKNNWCKENNIPIIRIPYTHLKNICFEDLKPETSKYVIT